MKHFLFCFLALILWNCKPEATTSDLVPIERLDRTLMAMESKNDLEVFLTNNAWYSRNLYRAFPDDTAFVSHLYYIISHPGTKAFYQEVDSTFGELPELRKDLTKAFFEIKKTYPSFVPPKVYATFTGLENDIFVSDSLIIIALEAFMGPSGTYRPDQPAYILSRYQKEYIVPSIIRLLGQSYISSAHGSDMLSNMMYLGKSFEFTKTMLPSVVDSLIIAMPDSSLQSNWYAQDLIWAHFVDKKLLYEQNPRIKEKYLGERPTTTEIGPSCPGRIAQWLGWRIVDKFRTENPDVSFKQLMQIEDAQEILRLSKYRGIVEEE
ncbi:MAG: hypothetical protein ACI9DJ_000905 [Algoriphagus sp.]|jgi:hypothetical protein